MNDFNTWKRGIGPRLSIFGPCVRQMYQFPDYLYQKNEMEVLVIFAWIFQAVGFSVVGAKVKAGGWAFISALLFGPFVAIAYCIVEAQKKSQA